MQENEFDKLFREKLGEASFTPPAKVWNGLDNSLGTSWYSNLLTKPVFFIAVLVGVGSAALLVWNQNKPIQKQVNKQAIPEVVYSKTDELKVTTEDVSSKNSANPKSAANEEVILEKGNQESPVPPNNSRNKAKKPSDDSKQALMEEMPADANQTGKANGARDAQTTGTVNQGPGSPIIKLTLNSNDICLNQQLQLRLQSDQNSSEIFTIEFGDESEKVYGMINQRLYHQYQKAGRYQIHCISQRISLSVNVVVHALPQAEFEYRISENGILEFSSLVSKSEKSTWNFGDGNGWQTKSPTFTYRFKGTENSYPVSLAVINPQTGCSDTFTLSVPNVRGHQLLDVNTFSPNGDAINDYFYLPASADLTYTLIVIDNKGEKVYEGNEKMKGWDGNYPGSSVNCPAGSYRYYLEYTFSGEEKQYKTGFITLVR